MLTIILVISDNAIDDIWTFINTLWKAVADLKDHLTSVSYTVKSLKEHSDYIGNLQHKTVQANVVDQPPIHQTGTTASTTEQTQTDNWNGTISYLGTIIVSMIPDLI